MGMAAAEGKYDKLSSKVHLNDGTIVLEEEIIQRTFSIRHWEKSLSACRTQAYGHGLFGINFHVVLTSQNEQSNCFHIRIST